MRRVTYIFLILVIAYLSALPLVTKASTNTNSTMQVVGNLSLVKSEVPEEDEETPLEEQRTILKEEKLPPTGIKVQEDLFFIGILLILLAMLVKTQDKNLK
ncbi:hypothetical protein [Lactococcus petauri]|uniref:hypothetical protein n=1 Tax=Lactococcus petauri TaxID=1940789 RepID=UPI00254BC506|nr:hypothetical protein [Lactococcus petauri]